MCRICFFQLQRQMPPVLPGDDPVQCESVGAQLESAVVDQISTLRTHQHQRDDRCKENFHHPPFFRLTPVPASVHVLKQKYFPHFFVV